MRGSLSRWGGGMGGCKDQKKSLTGPVVWFHRSNLTLPSSISHISHHAPISSALLLFRLYVNEQLPYSARAKVGVDLGGSKPAPGTMGGRFQSL